MYITSHLHGQFLSVKGEFVLLLSASLPSSTLHPIPSRRETNMSSGECASGTRSMSSARGECRVGEVHHSAFHLLCSASVTVYTTMSFLLLGFENSWSRQNRNREDMTGQGLNLPEGRRRTYPKAFLTIRIHDVYNSILHIRCIGSSLYPRSTSLSLDLLYVGTCPWKR